MAVQFLYERVDTCYYYYSYYNNYLRQTCSVLL